MNERLAVVVPVYNEPEITKTLTGLYGQSYRDNVAHYIVDNGSTDSTRSIIESFIRDHEDFPIVVVEEAQKGTGAACDTGFRKAIEDGAKYIARTDGDTVPAPHWTRNISRDLSLDHSIYLLGGRSVPLKDEYFRQGDQLLLPVAIRTARVALSLRHLDPSYLSVVIGHNMATMSTAYTAVGGFNRTSLDERDEDVDYSIKVIDRFGSSSSVIDRSIVVGTSMRRIRHYGIVGTSLHHLLPEIRSKIHREIDVR